MSNMTVNTFVEYEVGPTAKADGSVALRGRVDKTNARVITNAHGVYHEAASRGRIFTGSNLLGTAVTTQAGLSATTPALTLSNPTNSGYYASLLQITIALNAAPAAATTLCLALNSNAAAPTSTTVANIVNGSNGGPVNNAVGCFRVATLAAAPVATKFLAFVTAAALVDSNTFVIDLGGSDLLLPGSQWSIQATTAVAIFASFTWEEVPIV